MNLENRVGSVGEKSCLIIPTTLWTNSTLVGSFLICYNESEAPLPSGVLEYSSKEIHHEALVPLKSALMSISSKLPQHLVQSLFAQGAHYFTQPLISIHKRLMCLCGFTQTLSHSLGMLPQKHTWLIPIKKLSAFVAGGYLIFIAPARH